MEFKGFADMGVPEVPIVVARIFIVFMLDTELLEEGGIFAGLREKPVFRAVVDLDFRNKACLQAVFRGGEEVERTACILFTDDGPVFRFTAWCAEIVFHMTVSQAARMAVDGAIAARIAHGETEGTIAAHGKAANGAACAIRAGMERLFDEIGHFLSDVFAPFRALCVVGIETATAIRHDDDEWQTRDVAFNARTAHPDRMIVGKTMEKIEDRIRAFDIRIRQKDPCVDGFAEDVTKPVKIAE